MTSSTNQEFSACSYFSCGWFECLMAIFSNVSNQIKKKKINLAEIRTPSPAPSTRFAHAGGAGSKTYNRQFPTRLKNGFLSSILTNIVNILCDAVSQWYDKTLSKQLIYMASGRIGSFAKKNTRPTFLREWYIHHISVGQLTPCWTNTP